MASVTRTAVVALQGGVGYELTGAEEWAPEAVAVTWDGTAAAGSFVVAVSFYNDGGALIDRGFPAGVTNVPGDTGRTYFRPFGSADGGVGGTLETTDGVQVIPSTTTLEIGAGLVLTEPVADTAHIAATAVGAPAITVVDTITATQVNQAAGTSFDLGTFAGMKVGDFVLAFISTVTGGGSTGTVTVTSGAPGWTGVTGAFHDTVYVWRTFLKQITGLNEPTPWAEFIITGLGAVQESMAGAMLLLRAASSTGATRAIVNVSRTANLNPLVSGSLATLARPGDLLVHAISSKNGVGGISPPTGYTEVMDSVIAAPAAMWSYLSYKVAEGLQNASEQTASVTITPGAVGDHNDVSLVALEHYGPA